MDYEKIIKNRNETNAFANYIGLRITEMSQGSCTTRMPIDRNGYNPVDSVHGGAIFTMADVTGGGAASSYGYHIVTVDATIHYLRAGKNVTELVGHAREIKRGRQIMVYDVEVADQDGKVLAEGIFTYMPTDRVVDETAFD